MPSLAGKRATGCVGSEGSYRYVADEQPAQKVGGAPAEWTRLGEPASDAHIRVACVKPTEEHGRILVGDREYDSLRGTTQRL